MKWSVGLIAAGALICALGFVPLYTGGITISTLEGAASFVAIGVFVFLIGIVVRRISKALKTA